MPSASPCSSAPSGVATLTSTCAPSAAQLLCGGVADVHGGKHIHRSVFQLGKAQNAGSLTLPANVAHDAADGIGAFAVFQQNAHRLCQIVRSALGGGIVQRNAEIPHGGASQPLLNDLPRGQPVGKGNDAEIVRQRCAQHCPAAEGSGQPGHNFHGNVRVIRGKLQQGTCHAVHPGITGADQCHSLAGACLFQRPAAAGKLLRHAGSIVFLAGEFIADEVKIDLVSTNRVNAFQRVCSLLGHIKRLAGAKPHDIDYLLGTVNVNIHHVKHSATSSPGQRACTPAQRSRRCRQISGKISCRLRPALPLARRRYPPRSRSVQKRRG